MPVMGVQKDLAIISKAIECSQHARCSLAQLTDSIFITTQHIKTTFFVDSSC